MAVKLRRFGVFILLVLIVAFCVALPTIETIARDLRHINSINVVEIDPIKSDNNTSLVKRISLISSKIYKGEAQTLGFENGSKLTLNSAIENAIKQMDTLYNMGLLPESSDAYNNSQEGSQQIFISGVEFAVDNDNPSCNLILWNIEAVSDNYSLSIKMDDETGKVLMYQVISQNSLDWADELDFNNVSKLWSEYLGLNIDNNLKILYGNRAKIYLQMNNNLFLYSVNYDLNDIDDNILKVLRVCLYDTEGQVEYVLYHDLYEFGMVVE